MRGSPAFRLPIQGLHGASPKVFRGGLLLLLLSCDYLLIIRISNVPLNTSLLVQSQFVTADSR